ncbi:eppin isoform X2 [Hydra vulgaris]|uniref:Eppin isoform X2 n=1 Tax=Hydra vulgaris TaxID=6087 RepID=A0ABM4D2P8_HYDVU
MFVLLVFCILSFISSGQAKVSCNLVRCPKPLCESGVLPIKDPSGCCEICAKRQAGESCDVSTMDVCDDRLFCKINTQHSKHGICERINPDCRSPSNTGPCRGYFIRWFFNHAKKICKQFVYGGCGGNNNRYNSKISCEKSCAIKIN